MTTSTNVPIEKFGPPGLPSDFLVLDVLRGDKRSDQDRMKDNSERQFKVAALLTKAPLATDNVNFSVDVELGSSYISAHPDAVKTLIKIPQGIMELLHNKKRELALVHFQCAATSSVKARNVFINALSPILDHISYLGNVPLFIGIVECLDEKNNLRTYDYINPHFNTVVNPHEALLHERLKPIYALYREAKNGHSPFYKFLCYYKILEGLYNHVRPTFFRFAKDKGIYISREKELVPDHDELKMSHPDLIGKPIKEIFDARFTPEFRDEVAHYLLSDGAVLNVSDPETAARFGRELLPIELCARTVISVQERYEAQMGKHV